MCARTVWGEGCLWGVGLVKRDRDMAKCCFSCMCVCEGDSEETGWG